jgi:MtrB/PioB family decaheme-associated outer membrane protein
MKRAQQPVRSKPTIILLVLLVALSSAGYAAEADIEQLTTPQSTVSLGVGGSSGDERDRSIFGQFNGLRKNDYSALLDFSLAGHNDETGLWTVMEGRNLGLDNREINFLQGKQGNWKYSIGYDEITRHDIRTINSGLQGLGTATPLANLLATTGSGADYNLEIKRKNVSIGMEKWLTSAVQFEANFKNEDKDGARQFGRGFACNASWVTAGVCTSSTTQWGILLVPEAINTNTKQFDAKLNYAGERLLVSGGYYGSFFTNAYGTLSNTVPGTLNNPVGTPTVLDPGLQATLGLPIALPPNNQAHQFYVNGNYAFTPSTRSTFKYAYTHATQNQDFASAGLVGAPAGINSLGGVVDTSLAQLGLTARPFSKLSLLANVRFEDKKDKTPIALYNVEGVTSNPANFFTNGLTSNKKLASKVEAGYQLPDQFHASLGLNYDSIDRGEPDSTNKIGGLSALRAKTEELGYRAELRRSFVDAVNASLSYSNSSRNGGDWYSLSTAVSPVCGGVSCYGQSLTAAQVLAISSTSILPSSMADRKRDKLRAAINWDPVDRLSLQFAFEDSYDKYTEGATRGLRNSRTIFTSVDAAYSVSDDWKLTAYWSEGKQAQNVAHSSGYVAALENVSTAYSLGLAGKASSKLEVGGSLNYLNDNNHYGIDAADNANANNLAQVAAYDLPDVTFYQVSLTLFGKYAVQKNADIRLNYIRQLTRFEEWTWGYNGTPFAYSDNSTVSLQQQQNVSFLGISYLYKFK